MAAPLPIRTRLFTFVERFLNRPIDEVPREELPARRTQRAKLLGSPLGRAVSGRPHPDAQVTDRLVELQPVTVGELPQETQPVTLRLRIYQPPTPGPEPSPVVVLFHGGGWVLGDPEQDEWWASHLAVDTPCVVVSVAYRLAPEHPYPAAVLDTWAALDWVVTHADELAADPARIVVAGDSAGGNLAAVVADLAGQAGAPALAGQVLVYPAVEMEEVFPSEREHANAPVLTSRQMRAFSRLYLDGADPSAPTAAPLHGTLSGAAVPALIQVAGHDPLRDNGVFYAEALRGNGGDVTLTEYADAVHGYISLPGISPSAPRALAEIVTFVRRVTSRG
ncbi:alpha/beta hydrolase [Mumia sp. zg.B53]|uniref:alpha/beta hydrolase n=1 Tax=unclassified Mumia TaxID=2621872 RepID=UPI001C6F5CFB|nr:MULTISPECIES: alpha/beta hydrolase [unclassified Mumia]MBW9205937.1 alpha/beta hydrolase [Mumia sp. zg.B17]MBW9208059.1 alpha/beta hydrolase [Mumia sp. zg.B21]MBW9216013.1 alpha/beta hydrolase [Mumia sp. zg.B53]MDD9347700.1 alpha/beta hydrolase [Mumia sp.]